MKKAYLLSIAMLFIAYGLWGQKIILDASSKIQKSDSSSINRTNGDRGDSINFAGTTQFLRRTFLSNFLPQATGVNNYLSADIVDPKITLNLSVPIYNRCKIDTSSSKYKANPDINDTRTIKGYFWTKFKGEITNGIAPIWKNDDFSPKASFTGGFTFILHDRLRYFYPKYLKDKVYTKMATWDDVRDYYNINDGNYNKAIKAIESKLKDISDYSQKQSLEEQLVKLKKYREEDIGGAILKSAYSSYSLQWLDLFGTFSPQKIYFYNGANNTPAGIITSTDHYRSWEAGLLYNNLLASNNGSTKLKMWLRNFYWSLGVKAGYTDNSATLDGMDLTVTKNIIDANDSISTISIAAPKKTGYNITEFRRNYYLTIPFDFYKYLSAKRKNSIHLFAQYRYNFDYTMNIFQTSYKNRSDINLGIGYVITASAKDKTVTLIEPMVQIVDLTNSFENRKFPEVKQRIFFGLRTSIPIENLFKAK